MLFFKLKLIIFFIFQVGTPLNQHYPHSFREKTYLRKGFPRGWHVSSMNLVAAVAEGLNRDPEKLRTTFDLIYDLVKPSSKHRNVICHGDLWPNNMMFNDVPHCVLVDFQTIRYAPLVLDILQFLYLNTTRQYREKNERHLIAFYHSVLEETIKNNDKTQKAEIPTLEEVIASYEDFRLFGTVAPCLYFPIHLIDQQFVMDNPLKDSEGFENFVVGDRVEVTLAAMKKDTWFKNKIEQAVIEFSEVSEGNVLHK